MSNKTVEDIQVAVFESGEPIVYKDAVYVDDLEAGDIIHFEGKTWEFLGTSGVEAFFKNVKSRKYPSYAHLHPVFTSVCSLWDLRKMDCTIDQLQKAHNFL